VNGNGNGLNGAAKGLVVGVPVAAALAIAGVTYKSVDDRIEVRRQENARLESKVLEHEGKIATALSERAAMEREMNEIRATLHEVQQEQARRTPYIKGQKE